MFFKKHRYTRRKTLLKRLLGVFFTVVVLSALILGAAYFVQIVSGLDNSRFVDLVEFVVSKVGIDSGLVSGVVTEFIEKASETDIPPLSIPDGVADDADGTAKTVVSLAIMSDSENDFDKLRKAVDLAKGAEVDALVFLGDFTRWGDLDSLRAAKQVLDESDLKYYSVPGDHDLAESVQGGDPGGLKNFGEVFGSNYHKIVIEGVVIVIMDNSANFTTIDASLISWLEKEIKEADFVMLSQPLYHPTNLRVMGIVDGKETIDVRNQTLSLLDMIRESDTKAIIAADQHVFSQSEDPVRKSLTHFVVGALVGNDDELRNPQSPRFVILTVFEDGKYEVEEIIL